MDTLAKLARCARCTVAKSIAHLEALGYLRRTPRFRPKGGVTSNAYQLMPLEARKYPPPLPQRHKDSSLYARKTQTISILN
jgi:hypothetical protein